MDDYFEKNNNLIGFWEKKAIREFYNSSLLDEFTHEDYLKAIALIARVVDRLEGQENG